MTGSSTPIAGFGRQDRDAIALEMLHAGMTDHLASPDPSQMTGELLPNEKPGCGECDQDHVDHGSCLSRIGTGQAPQMATVAALPTAWSDSITGLAASSEKPACSNCERPSCPSLRGGLCPLPDMGPRAQRVLAQLRSDTDASSRTNLPSLQQ